MLGTIKLFQMVDRLDDGSISADLGTLDYKGLYKVICFTGPKFHGIESFAYYLPVINVFRLLQRLSSEHMLKDNLRFIVCPFCN